MNLVGQVGETDETHELLANYRGVLGGDEGRVGWAGVTVLRESITVAAGVVGHLSERAWGERWTTGDAREAELC